MRAARLERYLLRETAFSWLGVTLVLLAIMLATRFARFLGQAAQGRLPEELLFQVAGLSCVQYLIILTPISLLLAVMIALGRLYRDQEVTAMLACGAPLSVLYRPCLWLAAGVALLTALLAFELGPWAGRTADALVADAARANRYNPFEAGRFKSVPAAGAVLYTGRLSDDGHDIEQFFGVQVDDRGQESVLVAEHGRSDADPVTGDSITVAPNTNTPVSGLVRTEFYPEDNDVEYRLYNGTLEYDFGPVSLTSVTSYGELDQRQRTDNTIGFGSTVTFVYQSFGGRTDDVGVFLDAPLKQEKFTQEVRLASADGPFEWQIGGYFTDEKVEIVQSLIPFVQDTGVLFDPTVPGFSDLLILNLDSEYEEIAGFANVSLELTPWWEIGGGIRYSQNDQSVVQTERGAFQPLQGLPSPNITQGESSEDVVTWSADTRIELSGLSSIYARVAKGYRPGGPNVVPPGAAADFPRQYDADTLISYELGFRGETIDRSFAIDAAVYYLDWNDILIFGAFDSAIGPVGANDNGGDARVYGAELTATIRPVDGFSLVLNGAYNDAELVDDTPPVTGGLAGDQLPYTPELTATMSVDYEWSLGGGTLAFVGGDGRLASDQAGGFDQTYRTLFGRRLQIDGYQKVDLRAGVAFDNFSVTAFANNVTNSRGLTSFGDLGDRPGNLLAASPIRPRTFGVTAAASF